MPIEACVPMRKVLQFPVRQRWDPLENMPSTNFDGPSLFSYFSTEFSLTNREVVALMGAHTVGHLLKNVRHNPQHFFDFLHSPCMIVLPLFVGIWNNGRQRMGRKQLDFAE